MKKLEEKKGVIIVNKDDGLKAFKEKFNSKTYDKQVTFPKALGAEHPFNFEDVEKLYCKEGLVYGAVNRYVNSIIGEFSIKTKNPNATKILSDFVKESGFKQRIRDWLVEGFVKGNGFLEIDLKEKKLKLLNANQMYVIRDDIGQVTSYNQYIGDPDKFNAKQVISFKPNQIAHIKINCVGDSPYGLGILWPNERVVQNIVLYEEQLHVLMKRKAGAPIHFKVGVPGEQVNPSVIQAVQQDLQYLTNKTEWVTDANVDIKVIDFEGITKNLTEVLNHDLLMFSYGTLIPESLMGKGNLAEGLGDNNMLDWNRLISSYQDVIESIVEEKIFKQILLMDGLSLDIDFSWNLPSENEINERITKLTALLSNQSLDENIRRYANIEIAKLLGWEGAEDILQKPSVNANEERAKEEALKQPETPGAKPSSAQTAHVHLNESDDDLSIKEWCNMQEIQGFNYTDYITKIIEAVNKDDFTNLRAIKEGDMDLGLLSDNEIEKLRVILKNGFKDNMSMRQIITHIKSEIQFKDRVNEKGELLLNSESRPEMIGRTETVRLSNEGLVSLYKDNGIQKVRWLAALSDRTCAECEALNGQVYSINEIANQPPLHPNCFLHHSVRIMTENGWKTINLIKEGDNVLTHNGRYRKVTKVLDKKERYEGEAVQIRYKGKVFGESNSRNSVTVTPEHPLLTQRGWVQARDLELSDCLFALSNNCHYCGKKIPYWKTSCSSKCSATQEVKNKISKKNTGENNGMFGVISIPILQIKHKEKFKGEKLYNFSVEEDESYIAEGLVNHNCRCSLLSVVE